MGVFIIIILVYWSECNLPAALRWDGHSPRSDLFGCESRSPITHLSIQTTAVELMAERMAAVRTPSRMCLACAQQSTSLAVYARWCMEIASGM